MSTISNRRYLRVVGDGVAARALRRCQRRAGARADGRWDAIAAEWVESLVLHPDLAWMRATWARLDAEDRPRMLRSLAEDAHRAPTLFHYAAHDMPFGLSQRAMARWTRHAAGTTRN